MAGQAITHRVLTVAIKPNYVEGSFRVIVDLGRAIGTKGETGIRIVVVTTAGSGPHFR